MRAKYLDQALVLRPALLQAAQLVARRAEGAGGGVAQAADRGGALARQVDQVLGQHADDAVAPGVDLADVAPRLHGGLDHPAGRGIDDG